MARKDEGTGRIRPNARARAAQLREQQRRKERRRRFLIIGGGAGVVIIVVVVMVLVATLGGGKTNSTAATLTAAPPSVVSDVTNVPTSVWQKVGQGSASLPKAVNGPALTKDGKARIVYIGAEYCPYCAAERWAVVNALSRFGTWSNLGETASSSIDVNPSTPTFTFRKATYTSNYITFEAVETQSNQIVNGGYKTIATPTAEQQQLEQTYGQDSSGQLSIPFIDFGNKYVVLGASYDSSGMSKKSMADVAATLSDPSSTDAQGILGTANVLTATICKTTGNKPANVCTNPAITAIGKKL